MLSLFAGVLASSGRTHRFLEAVIRLMWLGVKANRIMCELRDLFPVIKFSACTKKRIRYCVQPVYLCTLLLRFLTSFSYNERFKRSKHYDAICLFAISALPAAFRLDYWYSYASFGRKWRSFVADITGFWTWNPAPCKFTAVTEHRARNPCCFICSRCCSLVMSWTLRRLMPCFTSETWLPCVFLVDAFLFGWHFNRIGKVISVDYISERYLVHKSTFRREWGDFNAIVTTVAWIGAVFWLNDENEGHFLKGSFLEREKEGFIQEVDCIGYPVNAPRSDLISAACLCIRNIAPFTPRHVFRKKIMSITLHGRSSSTLQEMKS